MTLDKLKEKIGADNLLVIQGAEKTYQKRYVGSNDALNDFEMLEFGKAYWIEVANSVEISYTPKSDDRLEIVLLSGWNMINPLSPLSLESIKTQLGDNNLKVIQGAKRTYQKRYLESKKPLLNDFNRFENQNGYLIEILDDGILNFRSEGGEE